MRLMTDIEQRLREQNSDFRSATHILYVYTRDHVERCSACRNTATAKRKSNYCAKKDRVQIALHDRWRQTRGQSELRAPDWYSPIRCFLS